MKYLITSTSGEQVVLESDKSLAHLSLDFSPSTDIQPIQEESELETKPAAKKSKTK